MVSVVNKLRLALSKTNRITCTSFQALQSRQSSFKSSPFVCDIGQVKVTYETSNDPTDWEYVDRILPLKTVPKPVQKTEYASEWKPQSPEACNNPFFVERTKNHMMPVYLKTADRGQRKMTYIKKIQGDIWLLEEAIKGLLQKDSIKPIRIQVNEFVGYICIYGDHVNAIKDFLLKKNC